jgi:hypothetical protein
VIHEQRYGADRAAGAVLFYRSFGASTPRQSTNGGKLRDTFRLLIQHLSQANGRKPSDLTLDPVKVFSRVFRGKFIAGLKRAFKQKKLRFPGSVKRLADRKAFDVFLRPLFRQDWVVYAKRPFGGPQPVLHYLARYTHRVAISNHRIINVADGKVTFRWKDYVHKGKQRLMTITAEEFLRWFLLHTLPRGFVRIRFCGFLANRRRGALLPLCQELLKPDPLLHFAAQSASAPISQCLWLCPHCGGEMGADREAYCSTDPLEIRESFYDTS